MSYRPDPNAAQNLGFDVTRKFGGSHEALSHPSRPGRSVPRPLFRTSGATWDALLAREDLLSYLQNLIETRHPTPVPAPTDLLPPVASQEIWAAGVTYLRSREARHEESEVCRRRRFL